jgi:hypothetical protein
VFDGSVARFLFAPQGPEDCAENLIVDLLRRGGGVERLDDRIRIAVEDANRFRFEKGQSTAHHFRVAVVGAVGF